jgi:hypothetical protein
MANLQAGTATTGIRMANSTQSINFSTYFWGILSQSLLQFLSYLRSFRNAFCQVSLKRCSAYWQMALKRGHCIKKDPARVYRVLDFAEQRPFPPQRTIMYRLSPT